MEQYSAIMKVPSRESDRDAEIRILTGNYQAQRNDARDRLRARYGQPDQVEYRTAGLAHLSQIWRYNYLASFGGSAEFEFPMVDGKAEAPRISRPLPVATFEGTPSADVRLKDVLNRESQNRGLPPASGVFAGLPSRRASMQIYAAPGSTACSTCRWTG